MSMQTTDPIADLLTRIRNAKMVGKTGEPAAITEITRVSKPGRRVYVKSAEIPKVKSGRGIVLISTSQGVMTGHEAARQKLGGELLLKVY